MAMPPLLRRRLMGEMSTPNPCVVALERSTNWFCDAEGTNLSTTYVFWHYDRRSDLVLSEASWRWRRAYLSTCKIV